MLRIESPPRVKKLSSTPTRSSPRVCAQTSAIARSTGVRGATYAPPAAPAKSGAGSARRSSFPLAVRGNAGTVTKADGTRYSGSAARVRSRSSSGVTSPAGTT